MKLITYVFAIVLLLVSHAVAHTGGFTYEVSQDNYFVDIGSSNTQFTPGQFNLFEYNIFLNTDPNNLADFDSVYVTLSNEQRVIFSGLIHRPAGALTTASFDFPQSGKYEMSARFQKAGEKLTEVTFPFEVQSNGLDSNLLKIGIIFGLLGLAIGYGSTKLKKPVNS